MITIEYKLSGYGLQKNFETVQGYYVILGR